MKKHSKKLFSLCLVAMALSGATDPVLPIPQTKQVEK